MPDLQSELRKLDALSFDDAGTPHKEITMTFTVQNNVTRRAFDYVRDNPKIQRRDAIRELDKQGISPASSSSLLSQFVRQGMMKIDDGALTVTQPHYTPIKARLRKAGAKVTKATAKTKRAPIIEATPVVEHTTSVKSMLSRMSIVQAREMYVELKQIFEVKC